MAVVAFIVCCAVILSVGNGKSVHQDDDLSIIILGDWGQAGLQGQERVADAMAEWAAVNNPDWILSVGDQFYPKGLRSTTDRQIDIRWRQMYSHDSLAHLNWYISLGNHDYGDWEGEEVNTVELAKVEPRWIIPHHWYDFVEYLDGYSVHFIVIDTEAYHWVIERNNYTDMMAWFNRVLSQSTADWKFIIGHRHIFSVCDHGPVTASLYNYFVPIMEHFNVDAYICGHDHNLQHIRPIEGAGMDYILSRGGGAAVYRCRDENEEYLAEYYKVKAFYRVARYGFVTMKLNRYSATFDYHSPEGELLYTYTRNK